MPWAAAAPIISAVAPALLGGLSGKKNAKEQNQPTVTTTETDQTQTRDPYMKDQIDPVLQQIMGHQGDIFTQQQQKQQALQQAGKFRVGSSGKSQAGEDMVSAAGKFGLGIGNDPLQQFAKSEAQRRMGADSFDGSNDYLSLLAGKVSGANMDDTTNLLMQFLGGNPQSLMPGIGPGRAAPSPGGVARGTSGGGGYSGGGYGGGGMGGSGGQVPDTMAGDGFFQQKIRELFDPARLDPANDPTIDPYADAITRRSRDAAAREQADISRAAEGAGRFGGDAYNDLASLAAGRSSDSLNDKLAEVFFGSREAALGRQMEGLQGVNQRDLAAMQDRTQRYGADSASAASSAASGAAAASAANALQAQLRGQDLSAINSLIGSNQFGMSQLGQIGGLLDANQQNAMSMVPGLLGTELSGAGLANNSGNILLDNALGRGQLGSMNAQNSFNNMMGINNMGQQNLNNYLNTIGAVGNMGGTTHNFGTETATTQGPRVSESGAFGQGLLGGALTGLGEHSDGAGLGNVLGNIFKKGG